MDTQWDAEAAQLEQTRRQYREVVADARAQYESIPSLYRSDPDLLNDMLLQIHNRIARLERGMDKPYFARIDFTADGESAAERCYIGKIGVSDEDGRIITVDWRAPVSTLYYDSSVGPASYAAPGGTVHGTLGLKRQIEIERGKLVSFNDVDTVSNDELLKPFLSVSADSRLKNIVASIQGEQNRIIREKLETSLVVQGAAGSGKTTVALHRIAYLAYTYRDSIRSGQYLIVGPNAIFNRYISAVLPDLDVDSVPQYTFAGLAGAFISEPYTLSGNDGILQQVSRGDYRSGIERYKTSMRYRVALDRFLDWFEGSIPPDSDFSVRGVVILTRDQVRRAYASARVTEEGSILARVDKCRLALSGVVRNTYDALEAKVSAHFREMYRKAENSGELEKLHRDRAWVEKELEKGCRASLKNYFSRADTKILALYRQFLRDGVQYLDSDFPEAGALCKNTLALLRDKKLSQEDLAAVMYLKARVRGSGAYSEFRHAIVDEAQDYGEFELFVLAKLLCGSTFTVVGDIAQAVYSYRSIEDWTPVLREALPGAQLREMRKSYRTTVEIMEAANAVTEWIGLAACEPVIRHGAPVGLHPVEPEDLPGAVLRLAREHEGQGFRSIAVVCRDEAEAERLDNRCRALGGRLNRVGGENAEYEGGLCILTAFQAKGLEFDSAIVADAARDVYNSDRRADMHLLYVAMTRPLHRLDLLCTGALTAPLASYFDGVSASARG